MIFKTSLFSPFLTWPKNVCFAHAWPSADTSFGHPPCHDYRAGNGCRTPLPPHPAGGALRRGESSDPAAHARDQRRVREVSLNVWRGQNVFKLFVLNYLSRRHDLVKKMYELKDTNSELAGLLLDQVPHLQTSHFCVWQSKMGAQRRFVLLRISPPASSAFNLKHLLEGSNTWCKSISTSTHFSYFFTFQIYDNAMITAGLNDDPRPMISRLNELLTKALEKHWRFPADWFIVNEHLKTETGSDVLVKKNCDPSHIMERFISADLLHTLD